MRDPSGAAARGTRSLHSRGPRPPAPRRPRLPPSSPLGAWKEGWGLSGSCPTRIPDLRPSRVADMRQFPGPRAVGFEALLTTRPRRGNQGALSVEKRRGDPGFVEFDARTHPRPSSKEVWPSDVRASRAVAPVQCLPRWPSQHQGWARGVPLHPLHLWGRLFLAWWVRRTPRPRPRPPRWLRSIKRRSCVSPCALGSCVVPTPPPSYLRSSFLPIRFLRLKDGSWRTHRPPPSPTQVWGAGDVHAQTGKGRAVAGVRGRGCRSLVLGLDAQSRGHLP